MKNVCVICKEIYETEGVFFDSHNICEFCINGRRDDVEAYLIYLESLEKDEEN